METKTIRILCTDDDETILDLLQLTLDVEPDMESVGALTNADDLVSEIASKLPDIVILDLNMPGKDPIEAIQEVSADFSESRIIVHSGSADQSLIDRLFAAGACGFVMKGLPRAVLIRTIRDVAFGRHLCLAA